MKKRRKEKTKRNEDMDDKMIRWGDACLLAGGVLLMILSIFEILRSSWCLLH